MAIKSIYRRAGVAVAGAFALAATGGAAIAAAKIAVITPYLAQPGTQFYVEAFQEAAKANGWDVNVIDTKGDVAAVISRIEDVSNQKVDAIVINVDPGQVAAGLETAKSAGIPVFGMDAGANPLLVTNVTSNGYSMAADTAAYVANRINGKGNVVMFVYDAFPPVHSRDVIADAIFKNNPDIKVLARVTPDVKDGGIADSRARMEAILAANPARGSIAAVWAAWDSGPCRRSTQLAAPTKALSSPASTPIHKRAKRSPREATSRPRWPRTSRASAVPPPTPSSALSGVKRSSRL